MAGGFKGFQQVGGVNMTVKTTSLFEQFPSTDFGNTGMIGGIPSTNLAAWFRPDVNITLDGSGNVSQWQDTTGTYTLVQSTSGNRPAYTQNSTSYNGRPYLDFSGSSTKALTANGSSFLNIGTNTQLQVIMLMVMQGGTQLSVLAADGSASYSSSAAGSYGIGMYTSPNGGGYYHDSTTFRSVNGNVMNLNSLNMHSFEVDRGAGKIYFSYNSVWRNLSGTANVESTNYTPNNWKLQNPGSTNPYIMDILVYIGGNLSQQDYLTLRNYFGILYNF